MFSNEKGIETGDAQPLQFVMGMKAGFADGDAVFWNTLDEFEGRFGADGERFEVAVVYTDDAGGGVEGASQFFSDLLISNPDYLEMLRIPLRSSPSKAEMVDAPQHEVEAAFEDSAVLRAFRRFRALGIG